MVAATKEIGIFIAIHKSKRGPPSLCLHMGFMQTICASHKIKHDKEYICLGTLSAVGFKSSLVQIAELSVMQFHSSPMFEPVHCCLCERESFAEYKNNRVLWFLILQKHSNTISQWASIKELGKYHIRILMPHPCSHFYFDIKFGDRLYSKEKRGNLPVLF